MIVWGYKVRTVRRCGVKFVNAGHGTTSHGGRALSWSNDTDVCALSPCSWRAVFTKPSKSVKNIQRSWYNDRQESTSLEFRNLSSLQCGFRFLGFGVPAWCHCIEARFLSDWSNVPTSRPLSRYTPPCGERDYNVYDICRRVILSTNPSGAYFEYRRWFLFWHFLLWCRIFQTTLAKFNYLFSRKYRNSQFS